MEEPYSRPHLDQAGVLRRARRPRIDPGQGTCPPQQRRIPGRVGRRQQHQPPRRLGQQLQPPPEALLDPPRQPRRPAEPGPARQLGRRHAPRQFQQRQRVPRCLGHDPVDHLLIRPLRQHRGQQRPCVGVGQPRQPHLGRPGRAGQLTRLAARQQHRDRVRLQPPRREPQRSRRRLIQPLHVIDHAQERPRHRRLRQQAQHPQADEERIRRNPGADPERRLDRRPLRSGQLRQAFQQRRAQLLQGGEGQLHLRLHPRRPHHLEPPRRSRSHRVLQQRRLAHPRLPGHQQHPASPGPRLVEHAIDHGALFGPAQQHRSARPAVPRTHKTNDNLVRRR